MAHSKHTPGELTRVGVAGRLLCIGDETIAIMNSHSSRREPKLYEANADRFILTWNCHDDLIAACKISLKAELDPELHDVDWDQIHRAIAKAEAKPQ